MVSKKIGFAVHAIEAVIALFLVIGFIIFITPGILTPLTTEEITRATVAAGIKTIDDNGSMRRPALSMNFSAINQSLYNVLPRDLRFAVGVCNTNSTILNWSTAGSVAYYLNAPPNSYVTSLSIDLAGSQVLGNFPNNLTLDAGNDTTAEFSMFGVLNDTLKIGSALLGTTVNASNRWLAANLGCDAYLNFPTSNASDNICEVPLIWSSSTPGSAAVVQRVCVSSFQPPENVSIITIGYMFPGVNSTFRPTEFFVSAWRG